MDEIELDEGALYGEESGTMASPIVGQVGSVGGTGDAGQHESPRAADSDEEAATDVEVSSTASRGSIGTSSFEGAIAPIPENEIMADTARSMAIMFERPRVPIEPRPIGGVKMGSSAPISIPLMKPFTAAEPSPKEEEVMVSATFVPPHMIGSMTESFGFDWEGASPAAVLKKEKLRARNQILRSTGFLGSHQDFARAQLSTMMGNVPPRPSDLLVDGMTPIPNLARNSPIPQTGGLKAAMKAQNS